MSNTPRRGLGRGLGSLIPARSGPTEDPGTPAAPPETTANDAADASVDDASVELVPVAGATFAELALDSITANPRQPRTAFDDDALGELAASIRAVGVLQPVVVRAHDGGYELIMGERRWRAAQLAGLTEIPAIVRDTSDEDLLRDALLENLHRSDLNPLDEAAAYQQLLDDFGTTHEELAARIGKSRPHVTNTVRLLRLSPPVQRRVAAGVLSAGHARALVGVDDATTQDQLASRVVAEGLSVRGLEELIALGAAPGPVASTRHRPTAPGLADIAERLSERYETRCRVELGRRKGKIVVEFASLDDLQRILAMMEGTAPAAGPDA